jgi:hypothetical protein
MSGMIEHGASAVRPAVMAPCHFPSRTSGLSSEGRRRFSTDQNSTWYFWTIFRRTFCVSSAMFFQVASR